MTLHLLPTKADIMWQQMHPLGRSPVQIARDVAKQHNLTLRALRGPSRLRKIVRVRQEAMAEIREARPDVSLPMIGRIFNRDHTTVLHALRAVERRKAYDL